MATIISSQRYLDDDIVQSKIETRDFVVTVGPEIIVNGETYRVVYDGHHSLAAAHECGVAPEYVDGEADAESWINIDVDKYLEAIWVDSAYYDVATGVDIW